MSSVSCGFSYGRTIVFYSDYFFRYNGIEVVVFETVNLDLISA